MSSTINGKKLSRREREEQKITRRYMMIGGGVLAAAALGGTALMMSAPVFPALEGEGTIDERLAQAGVPDHALRLTPKHEGLDVLMIGTTDCVHCRNLVANGMAEALADAESKGYGLAYAPIGYSAKSLDTTKLLNNLPKAGASNALETLQSVYEASALLGAGQELEVVAGNLAEKLGADAEQLKSLLEEDPQEDAAERVQKLTEAYAIKGTPMIFVASKADPSKIHWFSGFSNPTALLRQIETARNAK